MNSSSTSGSKRSSPPVKITSFNLDFSGRRARLGVIEDLTERLQAEERARQSERRYRDLLASQSSGNST